MSVCLTGLGSGPAAACGRDRPGLREIAALRSVTSHSLRQLPRDCVSGPP